MNARSLIPLIDLGFLTLGAVVALLAQSEFVERLPIRLAEGPPVERADVAPEHLVIDLTRDGLFIDGEAASLDAAVALVSDHRMAVIVRPERDLPADRLIDTLAAIAPHAAAVHLEYQGRTD